MIFYFIINLCIFLNCIFLSILNIKVIQLYSSHNFIHFFYIFHKILFLSFSLLIFLEDLVSYPLFLYIYSKYSSQIHSNCNDVTFQIFLSTIFSTVFSLSCIIYCLIILIYNKNVILSYFLFFDEI